jgi:hypothetical protein
MRPRRLAVLLAILGIAGALRAADVEFVRVWPEWHDAIYFKRISEYFTDLEYTGHRIVVRSQPSSRAGYYFLARVNHLNVGLASAKFVLHIITPADPVPKTFTFPIDCPPGVHVFDLGLTGADWPAKSVHPVAWDLELISSDGHTLAARQSFLWAKPEK